MEVAPSRAAWDDLLSHPLMHTGAGNAIKRRGYLDKTLSLSTETLSCCLQTCNQREMPWVV